MKTTEKGKGTAKYIVGEVKRFDQKNEMFKRPRWQPELRETAKQLYGLVYPKNKDGHTLKDLAFKNAAWLHDVVRWLIKHTRWLDSLLVKMDDLFGYGKQERASKYWAD